MMPAAPERMSIGDSSPMTDALSKSDKPSSISASSSNASPMRTAAYAAPVAPV
jgi:hypothetical protein